MWSLTLLPSTDSTVLCIRRRQCIDRSRIRSPLGILVAVVDLAAESCRRRHRRGPGHRPCVRDRASPRTAPGSIVNDAGVATDGSSTAEDPAAEVVAEIERAGGEAVAQRGDIGDCRCRRRSRATRARHVGPPRRRDQQRGLRPAAHGVQPRRRRMGRRDPRAPARHVRRVAPGVPPLARAGEGARHHLRTVDQHRDRAAALRRRGPVELRRGQGGHRRVHRGGRDRDGALRRDRQRDHARRQHPARADRLADVTRDRRRPAATRRDFDPRDPVHVAELGCFLASPEAAGHLGPDVPSARRHHRARADVEGRNHVAARRPRLHRRRARVGAPARRGRQARRPPAARMDRGAATPERARQSACVTERGRRGGRRRSHGRRDAAPPRRRRGRLRAPIRAARGTARRSATPCVRITTWSAGKVLDRVRHHVGDGHLVVADRDDRRVRPPRARPARTARGQRLLHRLRVEQQRRVQRRDDRDLGAHARRGSARRRSPRCGRWRRGSRRARRARRRRATPARDRSPTAAPIRRPASGATSTACRPRRAHRSRRSPRRGRARAPSRRSASAPRRTSTPRRAHSPARQSAKAAISARPGSIAASRILPPRWSERSSSVTS